MEEGGREEARRPGAGGGGLATFGPPPRAPKVCTLLAAQPQGGSPRELEAREGDVPASVEMICSPAQRKPTE